MSFKETSGSGSGTVTSVSVTTANGVSGTVANATTTPAISLALGDITPTSVAASGTVTGSNLSGTNTGNQTITLTGNVTGSGTGSFAATIGSGQVTNAMLAGSIAASKLVGTDIATVGTVTAGTWSATAVGVAKGGTGANMSATGGAGHVVKQNSAGGAFTTGLVTGMPVVSRNTSDQNNSSDAYTDVTSLTASVTAGSVYTFKAYLNCVTSSTANRILVAVNGPDAISKVMTIMQAVKAAASGLKTQDWETYTTSVYDDAEEATNSPSTSTFPVLVFGTIDVQTTGTLAIRFKNGQAGNTVTVNKNSWLEVTQIA